MNKKEVDWLEQVRYMISDAANIVAVESHVLRYWEDELELTVPRNELGHRYYTQENVDQFLRIKQLKEEGYQLKAIRCCCIRKIKTASVRSSHRQNIWRSPRRSSR